MDFNKLLSKLKDIDPTNVFDPKGVSAAATEAVKPAPAVKLDEAAQLRVLAGRSTILAESALMEKKLTAAEKDKKEEVVKSMKKDKKGFMKRYGEKGEEVMHATATKIAKKKAESVEEGQEDLKKVGDKVKTSKGVMTKTATGLKHERSYEKEKDEDDDKPAKKATKVKEAAKPDFLDIDKDGNKKEPMKKAAADKGGDKKDGKKGMSAKQAKFFGKKNESAMMPKGKKRPVKESIEQKLTFVKCLQAVKESNGSLQIDPMDKTLWTWAQRVAAAKAGSGARADAYAAKVYESYGGEWSLYNTLVEEK